MKTETINNPWKLQYDEVLQQYHYINIIDNTVTFDLPCEVNYTPELIRLRSLFHIKKRHSQVRPLGLEMCKQTSWGSSDSLLLENSKKKSILARLGSMLRPKHRPEVADADGFAGSPFEVPKDEVDNAMSDVENYRYETPVESNDSLREYNSMISGLDDAYLLENSAWSKNFAGTSINNDADYESISSSDSIHSYYSRLPYDFEEIDEQDANYDKERERYELRLQFREELEI